MDQTSLEWGKELRKIRLFLLSEAKEIANKKAMLERIAEIYADFHYPEDMEKFIYYMPSAEGHNSRDYSKEERENKLTSLFEQFLVEEGLSLSKS